MNKFLFVLLFILGTLLIVQVVNATISETFPLSQAYGTPIIRNVELQKNDRLVGSFTITNIPWWSNSFVGVEGYACSVTILDPNNNVILEYTNKIGDSSYSESFNYTAFYSGVYTIEFGVGSAYYPPSGLGNPIATLNYNVVASSSSGLSFFGNLPLWLILTITVCIVAIGIVAGVYLISKRKKQ
jgi:hypothetical protein